MISFVIPVYKKTSEQFNRCVRSLLNMSVKDIEIIAVFDGEDAILQPHADKWAKNKRFRSFVIDHGGACKARNAGFAEAKGDYIAAWDADCYAEPEMAQVWLDNFRRHPEVDFVYSGYKWTDPKIQGYESEPFDPWILSRYNYIASMFPVKREKAVKWDEDLTGLQDWDYWRRIVEAGSKGQFIPGFGFSTEHPEGDKNSISGQGDKKEERIRRVREKHGDKHPDILVYGETFRREALILAKTLDADYFANPYFWMVDPYKMVVSMGLHPWDLENSAGLMRSLPKETKKAIYWTGYDADSFSMSPYVQVRAIMGAINKEINHNFAMDDRTLGILEDLKIEKVELLTFPREQGVPYMVLPDKFKVLGWADEDHLPHLKTIAKSMPEVEFDFVEPNKQFRIPDYTVILQFTNSPKLETGSRNALMNGRYLISNVQAPYAGYVSMENPGKFVSEVTERIEKLKGTKEINAEAQEYYLNEADPEKFKERMAGVIQ
jgi:glycosyltransferase involved in cell wall biosynthesis